MNYLLREEDRELIKTFREFGEKVFTPENVNQWRRDQGIPDEVSKEFTSLYFGYESSMDQERFQLDIMSQAIILEELSRCAGATLPFQNDMFNLQICGAFSDQTLFREILEDYRKNGRLMFSLGVSEPEAGSDTMSMQTNTRTVDGKIVLNGSKTFVNNGEYSQNILVASIDMDEAESNPGKYPPLAFWLVPRTLPGISAYPINKIGQSMLPFASIRFEDVELRPEYRLKGHEGGFRQLFRMLEFGRVFICASSLGMARAAMEDAVKFASERMAFGKNVSSFQQVECMLTDMETKIYNMRSLLFRAINAIENDLPEKRLSVALMKRYIPRAATEVASDAIQVMGGFGYTESSRVSTIWEDCRGNQIAEGTDQIMVYIAAPLIMDKYLGRVD